MKKWMKDNMAVKARVLSANKGGLMIQIEGLSAFMPVSQLNPEHYPRVAGGDKNRILEKLREIIGKDLEVKIIDANEKEEKLIVSEKAVWEDAQKAVLESYKIGDVVEGEVSALTSFGAFVRFGQDLEGLVHISEIAPGRIRNLRDYVTEGKKIVCKVLNINHQGNIDLSLRRVPLTISISKMNDYKQEEKAEKLLEQIGKELKMDLKKVYDEIGYKAIEKYGGLYPFLQSIVDKGKNIIEELKPNQKLAELIFNTVKEKIKPIQVSVSGILNLRTYSSKGVEDITNILSNAKDHHVKVSYLGAPKYKLEVISRDYKTAENMLKGFLDIINGLAKKLDCEIDFAKND